MGELDNLESVKTRLKDDAQAVVEQQSFLNAFEDAIKLFELQPGFPGAQVWMRDRMSKLWQAASAECREFGSKARAKFALTQYNIRAASFHRLISTIETQNAFMALLDHLEHVAWHEFIGFWTPKEIRAGSPSIAVGITRRKQWWTRKGYKRLANLTAEPAQAQPEENARRHPLAESAPRLDAQSATAANGGHENESARKARRLSATEQASPGGIEAFAAAEDRVDAPTSASLPGEHRDGTTHESSWEDIAGELKSINQSGGPLRADWFAYEGSEDYGVWVLNLDGRGTEEVIAAFGLIAARAIEKLGLSPIPIPQPLQHCPPWKDYCDVREEVQRLKGKATDYSNAVPYGLGMADQDAVDPCTRAWLELLRLDSAAFLSSRGRLTIKGTQYPSLTGTIPDVCGTSALYFMRLARDQIGARLMNRSGQAGRTAAGSRANSPERAAAQADAQWAVCPSFSAGDLAAIKEPLLFPSKARAQGWLDEASIFVHEWNHDRAEDSKSRDEWLQGVASMWKGSANATLPRLKRVPAMPAELGDNVYVCSLRKWVRSACKDVIILPVPVHKLEDDTGSACPLRLSRFLDPDHLDPHPAEFDELLEMTGVGDIDSWISCLAPDWDFPGIERQAQAYSEWHNFEGLQIDNLRRLFCRVVLGLEQQLTQRHPRLSATALRAFWTSWQVKNHLYEFGRRVDEYVSRRPRLQKTLGRGAIKAITFVEWKLEQICKNLVETADGTSPAPESETSDHIEGGPSEPSGQAALPVTRLITVIRNAGTATETRREIRMGGDFARKALFHPEDRVVPGEEIHHELFDEPRIVARVNPIGAINGVSFRWEAEIMPRSEWKRLDGGNQLLRFGDFNPPVLGALLPRKEYPKHLHHKTLPPVIALNADEEAKARLDGYGDDYVHQGYPKSKYHWTQPAVIVKNANEEAALGGGWANTPAAFDPYKDATRARPQQPNPVKWVDEWRVPGLSSIHRKKIEAQLWKADWAFWKAPNAPSADADSMRRAFDGIAKVLFEAGILTVELLGKEIPELVWDSAIAGGWWYLASEARKDIFPEQIGHYWVWRDESIDWPALFRAETGDWRSMLLDASAQTKPNRPATDRDRKRKRDPGIERLKLRVRKLRDEGLSYRDICDRLGTTDRPPHAGWRDLPWPRAYLLHSSAVTKWLSEACG